MKLDLAENYEQVFKIVNTFAEHAPIGCSPEGTVTDMETMPVATNLALNSAKRSLGILNDFQPMEKSGDRFGKVKEII